MGYRDLSSDVFSSGLLRNCRYNDYIIFISNRAVGNRDSGERTLRSVLRWDQRAQRRKSGAIVFRPGCVTIGVVVWSGWLRQHRSILKFGLPQLTRSRAKEDRCSRAKNWFNPCSRGAATRSEEHTSELQSLMRISYAVFCLKKKNSNSKYYQH